MKSCPYCKITIEDHWSYCPHCNKPLIVNLQNKLKRTGKQIFDNKSEFYNDKTNLISSLQSEEPYDSNINQDEEIEQRIQKIDETLQQKMIFGESIGSLLLEKSSLYYQKRDLSTSLKILESALNNFLDENDLMNAAISHNEIGLIHEDTGFFDDAIYHFEQAIEIFENIHDYNKLIQVYNNLANIYYILKDLEHSYGYYDNALKLAEQENLTLEEIKTSSNIVEILFLLKDFDKIKNILMRNIEYFRHTGDIYGVIVSLSKLGKLYYHLGHDHLGHDHFKQAYQYLQDALELIKKMGNHSKILIKAKLKWECFLYLGKLNLLWNNEELAEEYLLKSLKTVRIFENESIKESLVLENLAKLHELKDEYQIAINYYNLCNKIYYRFGNDFKVAEIKYKIAQIYMDIIQNESEAIRYFEEALENFEDLNYSKETAEIYHKLGDVYLNKGIIELALEYFEKAKKIYDEFQDEYNLNLITEKMRSLTN